MHRRALFIAYLTTAVASFTWAPGAAAETPAQADPSAEQDAAPAPTPDSRLTYRLVWDGSGVTKDDKGGWSTKSDKGYEVHVERGYLVTYGLEFIECSEDEEEASGTPSALDSLLAPLALLTPRAAWAGHGSSLANPVRYPNPIVEAVDDSAPTVLKAPAGPPAEYCKLHYLIARGNKKTAALPTDAKMIGATVFVRGTYRAAGADKATPFEMKTPSANGKMWPLVVTADSEDELRVDTAKQRATAVVTRPLAGLFDGVDFETHDDRARAWLVLKNIMINARVTVEVEEIKE